MCQLIWKYQDAMIICSSSILLQFSCRTNHQYNEKTTWVSGLDNRVRWVRGSGWSIYFQTTHEFMFYFYFMQIFSKCGVHLLSNSHKFSMLSTLFIYGEIIIHCINIINIVSLLEHSDVVLTLRCSRFFCASKHEKNRWLL